MILLGRLRLLYPDYGACFGVFILTSIAFKAILFLGFLGFDLNFSWSIMSRFALAEGGPPAIKDVLVFL